MQQGDRWRRLHQEDFCQALGKPPAAKYESNQSGIPGPTLAQMFALTRRRMQAPDILALLDITPGMRVLDVACGTGNLALPAARLGADGLVAEAGRAASTGGKPRTAWAI